MDRPLVALVLAGGVGKRLYPASRTDRPKQFLSLAGDDSLLSRTVARVGFADEVYVSTRPALADAVTDHAPDASVLVEPEPKDTGPALVYAAHRISEQVGPCVVLAVPSDHHVRGPFEAVARDGATAARETGGLVTFGIEPTRPATGYGYIQPGANHGSYRSVAGFHEKPDEETARRYVERGDYWNAGMFAFEPASLLAAARESPLSPLVSALEADDPDRGFASVDPVSVDRAIAERATNAYVVPAALTWDDLGSWDALRRVAELDEGGNAVLADALTLEASGNVVASSDHHVSVVGATDLVVAAFDDRVLVVPVAAAERVRDVVASLEDDGAF